MNSPSAPPAALSAEALGYPPASSGGWLAPDAPFRPRVALVVSYLRSQLAAALATGVDFTFMVALVEVAAAHYLAATACGALAGGVTAFLVNRHWSFVAGHRAVVAQAVRYALVWIGSVSLNCLLVYALTEHAGLPYTQSKTVTAVAVGALFNFPMHRYFVFR